MDDDTTDHHQNRKHFRTVSQECVQVPQILFNQTLLQAFMN